MRRPMSARIAPMTVPTIAPAGKTAWLKPAGGVVAGTAVVDEADEDGTDDAPV